MATNAKPFVEVGNVDGASEARSTPKEGNAKGSEIHNVELRPLKEDAPVPFGITVMHEQQSAETSPAMMNNPSVDKPIVAAPQFDIEDEDEELELAPIKPKVPPPFGIKVAHVQHSEYGGAGSSIEEGRVEDCAIDTDKDDLMQEDSISSGIDLAPLKAPAPIPVGIKVAEVKHSEYGGSIDEDKERREVTLPEEGSVSSGLELAPLKP